MMNNNNNTFEEYFNRILYRDPSKTLLELFPRLSHPAQSRFHEFFQKLKNNKESDQKNNSKNAMELNLYKIQNGIDKRTSLMIKNIPKGIDEINVVNWLIQLARLNYVFVPKDEFSNKILGFAFINVCDYTDILKLLKKLSILEAFSNNKKKIEVIYSHKQGLNSLTKSFGVSHIF